MLHLFKTPTQTNTLTQHTHPHTHTSILNYLFILELGILLYTNANLIPHIFEITYVYEELKKTKKIMMLLCFVSHEKCYNCQNANLELEI